MNRTGSNRRGTSRGRSAGRPAGRGASSRNGRTAGRTAPRTTASRTTASRTTAGRTAGQRRGAGSRGGGDSTLNIALLIVTILVGLASWLIGTIFYELFLDQIPRIFVIGAVFAILTVILLIVVHGISRISGAYEEPVIALPDIPGLIPILIAVGTVAVFFLSALFQWIYALDFNRQVSAPTSYVFVIDDSGSTENSDPNQMRYSAIDAVLEDVDESFPYMVYSFADDYEILRDMAPVSEGKGDVTGESYGGTAIRGVLEQVMEDYQNQVWDGGAQPKVILMTDGYATDISLFSSIHSVLKDYVNAGISVSTVGLDQVDEDLLTQIAETTGGVYVQAEDAGDLSSAMQSAVSQTSSRDLLSARYADQGNFRLALMRVVFLFILGTGIGLLAMLVYGNEESAMLMVISSAVKALAGALVMELGTGVFGMPAKLAWLILWILIAATIAKKPARDRHEKPRTGGADMLR